MHKEYINLVIAAIALLSTTMYIWHKLCSKKINYLSINTTLKYITCCILLILNYKFTGKDIKPFISTIIIMLFFLWLYKENIKTSILLPIYSQLIVLLSELIFVLIILIVFPMNEEVFAENYFGTIISNFSIALISCIIINLKITSIIYNKAIEITDKIKKYKLLFLSCLIIVIANLLTRIMYYKVDLIVLLIINMLIISVYTIFIFFYLKTNNNYLKVYDKYNITLNSLKEYENILSKYRISNHENKNQLLTIRGMVKNKKVTSYIDEIIENKLKDNEKLMFESLVIPEGGLRGLIYSKMLLMNEKDIHYDLCVDKILKTTDLTCISDDLMLNICNIVGVYLDNAIEAVENLDERYIIIEIYLDDTLNIAITNNYENDIDVDSIDKVGFSTKGNNHGYGLSLVKDILNNNKNITNVKHISEDEFTQEIKIKYKK